MMKSLQFINIHPTKGLAQIVRTVLDTPVRTIPYTELERKGEEKKKILS